MKYTNPRPEFRSSRTFVANLLAFVLLASQLAPLASAQAARGGAGGRQPEKAKAAQPGKGGGGGGGVKTGPAQVLGGPGITATKVDAFPDPDGNGRVDPGATITYTVTITNNGDTATGVVFNDTPDANTSLVPGSVNTSPIVAADAYNVIGNVRIQPTAAQGLLANDRDPDTGNSTGLTVTTLAGDSTAPFAGTSAQGGQVTSATTDGAFAYNPAPGFTGTDTFSYTVSDAGPDDTPGNADDTTDTATVTLSVGDGNGGTTGGLIWFVNAAAAAGGDGRLTSPFNCLVGVGCFDPTAADEAGDNIFLYTGTYADTAALTLLNNQRLIGQGASTTLAAITGDTVPAYSDPLPALNSTPSTVTVTSAAAGIIVTAGNNNTLRGFTVGNNGSGAKIQSAAFGTLTVSEVALTGTGQALNLDSGTLAATFTSISTTSAAGQGILLDQVAGTLTSTGGTTVTDPATQGILVTASTANLNFGNTSVSDATDSISLQNNSAGTRTFGTITTTGGSGVGFLHSVGGGTTSVTGATTITNPGGIGISIQNSTTAVDFAATSVNKGTTAGTGVDISNNSGNTTFNSLGVTASNGAGLVGVGNTGQINVTTNAGSIGATNGPAINITKAAAPATPVTLNFGTVASTNSPTQGVNLDRVSGNLAATTTNVTNSTGTGIQVQNTSAGGTMNFNNTTVSGTGNANADATGTGVFLNANAGGVTFADLDIAPDANERALQATNNTGTITTTSGDISATGNVTLDITGASAASRTPLAMTLTNLDSTNSSGVGVELFHVSGNFTVNDPGVATNVTNPAAQGIQVRDTAAGGTMSFGNTVVNTSGAVGVALGVGAGNGNAGNVTFADLDIAPDSAIRALFAQNNTGAITSTSGTVTTTNQTAVEITGVSAASRTPLNIQLTTVNTTGGGVAPNGIVLTNTSATGAPGGFRVLGNGGTCTQATPTCTGGRITATTGGEDGTPEDNGGIGVRLNNANQVFLTRMRIDSHPNFAVHGTNVIGFNLDASVLDGTNGSNPAFEEGVIGFRELTGTTAASTASSITNSFLSGGREFMLDVRNFNGGTLNRLTVNNNTFGAFQAGTDADDAVHLEGFGVGATFNVSFTNNIVQQARGDMVNFNVGTGGNTITSDLVMRGNTMNNTHPTILSGGGGSTITMGGGATVTSTYDISCNKISGAKGFGLLVAKTLGGGTAQGTIFNNTIGTAGVPNSASSEASGLDVDSRGSGTHTVLIKNNRVHGWFANGGMQIFNNQGSVTMNATVQGNLTTLPNAVNALAGLYAEVGALAGDTSVLNIIVGGAGANENNFVDGDPANSSDVLLSRIAAGGGTALNLSRGVSAASSVPQIITDNNVDPVVGAGAGTITFVNTTPALPPATDQTCAAPTSLRAIGEANLLAEGDDGWIGTPSTSPAGTMETPAAQPRQFILPVAAQPRPVAQTSGQMDAPPAPVAAADSAQPEKAAKDGGKEASLDKSDKRGIVAPLGAPGNVSVNIGTLNPGDSVTITFQVTVDNPFPSGVTQVSNQGTVSGSNFLNVLTDDPAVGGAADKTVTLVQAPPDINVRDASSNEPAAGSKNMPFTVTLSAPSTSTVTVNFTTADEPVGPGKAVAGVDYTTTSGTLTFAPGQTVQTISVPVLADADAPEPDETFLVNLSVPVNGNIVDGQAVGTITAANPAGTTLISELRTSGPGTTGTGDPNDEFVEIYNNTDTPVTVAASDASPGWGLYKMGAACTDTPVLIGTIPNGTVIPGRGHYLFVGSGYSLAAYAAGNLTLTAGIEDDRNVGLFNTTNAANLATGTRLDAVGFGTNSGNNCDLLREGSTLAAAAGSISQYTFVRNMTTGAPLDRNDNAGDFFVLSTTPATAVGATATPRLGAPGPENLISPVNRSSTIKASLADPLGSSTGAQNRVRDLTPDPANNSTFGTLAIRRKFTNMTGGSITRLRFRVIDITTTPVPPGTADMRVRTSSTSTISLTGGGSATVQGLTLETPPAQPNGGGWNSTVAAGTITPGTPLAAGASINVEFLLGLQQTGTFRFFIIIEAVPGGPPFGPVKERGVGADDSKDVPQN